MVRPRNEPSNRPNAVIICAAAFMVLFAQNLRYSGALDRYGRAASVARRNTASSTSDTQPAFGAQPLRAPSQTGFPILPFDPGAASRSPLVERLPRYLEAM